MSRFSKVFWITSILLLLGWLISIRGFSSYRDAFGTPLGPDFLQFYTGAKLFIEGRADQLYDFQLQIETQSEILHSPQEYLHPYIYPPLLAWGLQPLAHFDYRVAFLIWSIGGLLILWSVGKLFRFGFWFALGWFPIFATLSYGQNSFLSLGVVALIGWLWVQRGALFLAGFSTGLLLYKPQLFVAFVPIFLILKEWRILQGMVVSGAFYLAISFYFVPEQSLAFYRFAMERIPLLVAAPGFPITQFFDPNGFFRLLFPQMSSWIHKTFSIVVMLLFLRLFWLWLKSIPVENKAIRFAGAILILPWTNLYFLVYDWTLLLIAYGILKNQSKIFEGEQGRWGIGLLWIVALVSCSISKGMQAQWGFAVQLAPLVLGYFTYQFFILPSRWKGNSVGTI